MPPHAPPSTAEASSGTCPYRPGVHRQLDALDRHRRVRFLDRRLRFCSLTVTTALTFLVVLRALYGLWPTSWLAGSAVLLSGLWALSTWLNAHGAKADEHRLRRAELGVFAGALLCLSCLTMGQMETAFRTGSAFLYAQVMREYLLFSVVLVLMHGLIIPGGSRRSLVMTAGLAGISILTGTAGVLTDTAAAAAVSTAFRMELAAELAWLSGVAVLCATIAAGVGERIRDRERHLEKLGPYRLRSLLGSGGMGDVYLAEHQLLKRLCAVKLIHPEKAGDSRVRARFEREVKATAALTHPNTVQVYDYGTTDTGRFYYAMEFLDGMNLDEFVRRFGPMPPARVICILKQVCGALQEAWLEGLVHRDVKPSNIFLSERGHVYDVAKLLDFGLVRDALDRQSQMRHPTTQIQGSPSFMCPEQASGLNPDCRGDLYSLGAVAWFLLVGHPPYQDDNPVMLIVAHATESVPDIRTTGVDVPDDLAAVIMKCLARNPDDRFASPRELLLALEACRDAQAWTWQDAEHWWLTSMPRRGEHVLPETAGRKKREPMNAVDLAVAGGMARAELLDDTQIFDAAAESMGAAVPAG